MSNGLVVREGAVPLSRARKYAEKNKLPFIDLREDLAFTNNQQLSNHLSVRFSRTFRRPIRVTIESFFKGECFGKRFVAILPHDFLHEYVLSTKQAPKEILNSLSTHESRLS